MSKKWGQRRANVAYIEPTAPRFPAVIMAMSLDELREEWRQQENDLMRFNRLADEVTRALFDGGAGELPCPAEEWWAREAPRATADELVAAIKSLHELSDRQADELSDRQAEIESLRAQLAETDHA